MTKCYTKEEVRESTLEYFNGDELAADVFMKYVLRDQEGNILELNPDHSHRRIAKEFARIEMKYPNPMSEEEIYGLLKDFKYVVPQGSPMSGVGNPHQLQSISNCFVIDSPHDSYGGILFADQEQVQIMKRRGGVGFDISTIRPKGLATSNAARTTDGIGVFMERFSNTCREVAQGGRRGALMLTIDVNHVEIETFINIKRDLKKVTGANISIRFNDEFMNAVENDDEYILRWPVHLSPEEAEFTKVVKAKQVWDQFVESAWASAEPGALFWNTVKRETPADCYDGYNSVSTNPCLTADTQVAVADGRGYVEIGELAKSGIDVPVYAYDNDTGKIIIKKMRHPRLTGKNMPVYKVKIEGGHEFKATGNHTMILRDGSRKTVEELQPGDSLWVAQKARARFAEIIPGLSATQSQDYIWVKDCNSKSWKPEHRLIWEAYNGRKTQKGEVIHHIDFTAENNSIDNLQLMNKDNHDRFEEYRKKLSLSLSGLNNPSAFDVSNEEIIEHIETLTAQLGRRISGGDWVTYATENNLPKYLAPFRLNGKSFLDVTLEACNKLDISQELVCLDPRMAVRAVEAKNSGYTWRVSNKDLQVEKECEWCHSNFWISYGRREAAFCSHSCSNYYANRKAGKNIARTESIRRMHSEKAIKTYSSQLDVYTQLRYKLGRDPEQTEWAKECRKEGLPVRLGAKYGFNSWQHLKTEAQLHNHKVLSIEFVGHEDVFNGTVDDVHTLIFKVGEEQVDGIKNPVDVLIASEQCGEIVLSPYDSCRLMVLNLTSFVDDPFTINARFDYDKFRDISFKAQRLMDDMIDLEIECIDKIIQKITTDPQPDSVKQIELQLWQKIRHAAIGGRRTGLGITGLGDCLASLNIKYGSDESVHATELIYKHLALGAHWSSLVMAQERGAFPVFDYKKEKNHNYLNRMIAVVSESEPNADHMWRTTGRRNIALTTTAPVGSISCLTQTTSGIEPAYLLSYMRRRKITEGDVETKVDFVDELGDRWQEYVVYHHGVKKWMDITGLTNIEESPYHDATSADIDWLKSVEIQAAAQRFVDHSLSKTCNLPASATKELVSEVYMSAWKSGCKGFTVYRDGCRSGVLVSAEAKEETKEENDGRNAPKRPKKLECDIHHAKIKESNGTYQNWIVIIGLLDGRPYELFGGIRENIEIPRKYKSGYLVKNGKKNGVATYNLEVPVDEEESIVFKDIMTMFDNPTQGAFTRTVSLALRHDVPLQYVVEQLQKDKHSDMFSFSKVIARVLKGYVADGTKSTEKACPSCGGSDLLYQEGCITCASCGWSKCA